MRRGSTAPPYWSAETVSVSDGLGTGKSREDSGQINKVQERHYRQRLASSPAFSKKGVLKGSAQFLGELTKVGGFTEEAGDGGVLERVSLDGCGTACRRRLCLRNSPMVLFRKDGRRGSRRSHRGDGVAVRAHTSPWLSAARAREHASGLLRRACGRAGRFAPRSSSRRTRPRPGCGRARPSSTLWQGSGGGR